MYGDGVDKILQGNISNMIYLKSNEAETIEMFSKLSGITHVTVKEGKSFTSNVGKVMNQNETNITYNVNTIERPVIEFNDMAFIAERQSMVFRAGNSPIWNRNQLILPMSWKLFSNTIIHPGHKYTLQTVPTLSTAMEFDIRENQPNFSEMLDIRVKQAVRAKDALGAYQSSYGYSDDDMSRLDQDVVSYQVMNMIDSMNWETWGQITKDGVDASKAEYDPDVEGMFFDSGDVEEDTEYVAAAKEAEAKSKLEDKKIYANNRVSRSDLRTGAGPNKAMLNVLLDTYMSARTAMDNDRKNFEVRGDELYGRGKWQNVAFFTKAPQIDSEIINQSVSNPNSRSFSDEELTNTDINVSMEAQPEFIDYLYSLDSWKDIANGSFESMFIVKYDADDSI